MRYEYVIVKYVPEPVRGESINLGVLAGNGELNDWYLVHVDDMRRAQQFGSKLSFTTARRHLDRLDEQVARRDEEPLTRQWLEHLIGSSRSVLQVSQPATISANSAEEAAEEIFQLAVARPGRQSGLSVHVVRQRLREAYLGQHIDRRENLAERVSAQVGQQTVSFDFAIANGHVVQLAKAWSFQPKDPDRVLTEVQAWGYLVNLIRNENTHAQLPLSASRILDIPKSVDIEAVYLPPISDRGARVLDRSLEVFDSLAVHARPITDSNKVASEAVTALATSAG